MQQKNIVWGFLFLALGAAALWLGLVNGRAIVGTGICLALAVMFFLRARQAQ